MVCQRPNNTPIVQSGGTAVPALPTGRGSLTRFLIGSGLELGPGHAPLPLQIPGVSVRYVDRWLPEENRHLFPELASEDTFPTPEILANFDVDRLRPVADQSQDFIICSHVLEHLAEPIGFLDEIHRVLRPGGVVLILLPDRRRTWDRDREPTSLDHLVSEFRSHVTEVDDAHILEFLRSTEKYVEGGYGLSESGPPDPSYLEQHRRRSIHVHCWDNEEFLQVILFSIEHLHHQWDFLDGVLTEELGPDNIEFGLVLRRTESGLPQSLLRQRFEAVWTGWRAARLSVTEALDRSAEENASLRLTIERLESTLNGTADQLDAANAQLAREHAELAAVHRTKTFRYTATLRAAYTKAARRALFNEDQPRE